MSEEIEIKTSKDLDIRYNDSAVTILREIKVEAIKRAKFYKSKAEKYKGVSRAYFQGKMDAELFAHNLTEEDLE